MFSGASRRYALAGPVPQQCLEHRQRRERRGIGTEHAWPEPDGELFITSSTQAPFATRDSLAALFGLPVDRIRVRAAPLGAHSAARR